MKFQFNKYYFSFFLFLFVVELSLLFTKGFIRHTFGDYLIVILIYCFVMSFLKSNYKKVALGVLLFSFTIELIQLTSFLTFFNLENSTIAKTIFGNTFSIKDLIAYSLGIGCVLLIETKRK